MVSLFFYLGRKLSAVDKNWTSVDANLHNARKVWDRFLRILRKEGEDRRTLGRFYVTVVQATLIFGL